MFHQKSLVTEGDVMLCKYFFCNSYSVGDFKINLIFLNGPMHLLAYHSMHFVTICKNVLRYLGREVFERYFNFTLVKLIVRKTFIFPLHSYDKFYKIKAKIPLKLIISRPRYHNSLSLGIKKCIEWCVRKYVDPSKEKIKFPLKFIPTIAGTRRVFASSNVSLRTEQRRILRNVNSLKDISVY